MGARHLQEAAMLVLNFVASASVLVGIAILALAIISIRVANQARRVIFWLGKFNRSAGPGLYFIWQSIEWQTKLDLRTVTADVKHQGDHAWITRDNVPIKVDAVIW
jgi:regulator of protease activity HflC (stomatin/prohibitin superfamily)